jgi:N-acetylglucosamine-6-phosphate deacetylase
MQPSYARAISFEKPAMKRYLTAATLFTPTESVARPIVAIEDGRIISVSSRDAHKTPAGAHITDFGDTVLAPGMFDIHIHGAVGHDVMEAKPGALHSIGRFLYSKGVTSYLATTVTASVDRTLFALEGLADFIESSDQHPDCAVPLGIHLEGPFISHEKRGVHPPAHIQQPSIELLDRFRAAARGHISLMTVAPETEGAPGMITHAVRNNIAVSLGHSNATLAETNAGITAGARHATHVFNAMRPLDHREPGILGAVLANDDCTAEIIADGIHVHPDIVRLFLRAKGLDKAVLVTDAMSATGMGDGRYKLGDFEVEVKGDRCEFEGRLAGSVLTLDRAVRNMMKFTGCTLQEALRLATANPSSVVGNARKGRIAAGADADFAVLSKTGELIRTIQNGRV